METEQDSRSRGRLAVIWKRIWADLKNYKWAILGLILYDAAVTFLFGAFCPMVIVTGLPCPGCGTTRALGYVMRGDFGRAFVSNPCIYLWIAAGIYLVIMRYVKGKPAKGFLKIAGGIAVIMITVYLARMATQFPSQPPMVFLENNVLGKIFPFYNEFLQRLFGL